MNNSFIRSTNGVVMVIGNVPYTVESNHPNYGEIMEALRAKRWNDIPDLIAVTRKLKVWAAATDTASSSLVVDTDGGVILFNGENVRGAIAACIFDMFTDGFDITPMRLFLERLYTNPSNRAVEELFGWMEANGITITEDGYLLAFKRVQDDYKSFYDGTTDNSVGTYVTLPRNKVDDRSDRTCSHGLHFCSQEYLPSYHGGLGRVLLLKIDPADVVSIPTDYNNAKGRACRYLILDELKGDSRVGVETHNVVPQPVVVNTADVNETNDFKDGYRAGYKDGRGKKAMFDSWNTKYDNSDASQNDPTSYAAGYKAGRADGRNKKPNLHGGVAVPVPAPTSQLLSQVCDNLAASLGVTRSAVAEHATFVADTVQALASLNQLLQKVCEITSIQLGVPLSDVNEGSAFIADLGADFLDLEELAMAIEDEFAVDVPDKYTGTCVTVGDVVNLIRKLKAST